MPDLLDVIPGLNSTKARRTFRSLGKLLDRLDREGAQYPDFLAYEGGNAAEQAIALIADVPNQTANGAAYFVANTLPKFIEIEGRIARSLGITARTIRDIKSQQVAELQAVVESSQGGLAEIQKARKKVSEQQQQSAQALEAIQKQRAQADEGAAYIENTRKTAARLASGDARGGLSLEKVIRAARDKNAELEALMKRAASATEQAELAKNRLDNIMTAAGKQLTTLEGTGAKADSILKGATQAGLAGAYKTERDRLSKEQFWYAAVFYGIIFGIIAYAAFAIVPIFSRIVENDAPTAATVGESALLLAVRLAILIPAIWALLFTSRRHSKIETLQMDYAAKANTALAYTGYRDELIDDEDLSAKLKDGLLVRFLEHPERLLSKNSMSEAVDVGPDGLRYSSQSEPQTKETSLNE